MLVERGDEHRGFEVVKKVKQKIITLIDSKHNCHFKHTATLPHSTLQMLTAIENRLEELFQQIDILPAHRIEAAMRVGRLLMSLYRL